MSEFQTNILLFNFLKIEVELFFATLEKNNYSRIHKKSLPNEVPLDFKQKINEYVWWSITRDGDDIATQINLLENKAFAKHYLNRIIYNHFSSQGIITNKNFIYDTEIYIEDQSIDQLEYKKYRKFSLRIDNNIIVNGLSLLVSYTGDSFLLKDSVAHANIDVSLLRKVIYKGQLVKFKDLIDEQKADTNNIYPILNRKINDSIHLNLGRNYSENKYKKYFVEILSFYEKYLRDVTIGECIKIFRSGYYKPNDERVKRTSEESNLLLFGNNEINFIPYEGIKKYGPIQGPANEKPVQFIFIFHNDDKDYANKIYSYLKKGFKSFPGLESFVKIRFEIDTEKTIRFTNPNPIDEIRNSIGNFVFDPQETYAAIYISRINKDSEDEEEDEIYYKVKELLLHYKITSQVIFKENINNPSFNFFLPNIAIALLAKLNGIPWRLYRPIKNDLVIGIGADRSILSENRFIGNAFCFRNDGRFQGFNAFEKSDTASLADSLKDTIIQYIDENHGVDRLVIHYYKTMSKDEEKPIQNVLNSLNLHLPYVVISITESDDYLLFDDSYDGKMPQSGTYMKTKFNEYILCNNIRYSKATATRIENFPLPIKIKFQFSNSESIDEPDVVRDLIDQIYQFSRMYWKSVRQRNMPVTIEYSEIIAKMIVHFDNKELEPFARNSLWFL